MFDIGGPEILLIILIIIILFGPKKIPEAAQMIGKGMQKIRSAQNQFREQIDEIKDELKSVDHVDKSDPSDPPIREISASDLNISDLKDQYIFPKEYIPKNSIRHGFEPVDAAGSNKVQNKSDLSQDTDDISQKETRKQSGD